MIDLQPCPPVERAFCLNRDHPECLALHIAPWEPSREHSGILMTPTEPTVTTFGHTPVTLSGWSSVHHRVSRKPRPRVARQDFLGAGVLFFEWGPENTCNCFTRVVLEAARRYAEGLNHEITWNRDSRPHFCKTIADHSYYSKKQSYYILKHTL